MLYWFIFACTPEPTPKVQILEPSYEGWLVDAYAPPPASFSLMQNDQVLLHGHQLALETAPAGVDIPIELVFQLHNLSAEPLIFTPDDWLTSEVYHWQTPPPEQLQPGESATFTLHNLTTINAGPYESTLHIPSQDFSITIHTTVPPPLRMVLAADHGYLLTSDDYGRSYAPVFTENRPFPGQKQQALVWGNGRFLRGYAHGDVGGYEFSDNAIDWHSSIANTNFPPSDCTYGMQRFVCIRADTLSWSNDAKQIEHEPTLYDYKLNTILFTGTHFIAAGRGSRRVVSEDGINWQTESLGADPDTYNALVYNAHIIVAGGGINRYYLSYSEDDGVTWTDIPYGGCENNTIMSMIYHNDIFIAQGQSNCHHNMHRSIDGKDWQPITELHPFESYFLLGSINGWIIAQTANEPSGFSLYRSRDGIVWEHTYDLPEGVKIHDMAAEKWIQP